MSKPQVMKNNALLSLILGICSLAALPVTADINPGSPVLPGSAPRMNCDLMASNTVRATYKGMEEGTTNANFEVVENLAHRRYVRYGDGALPTGFAIQVNTAPGQPGQPDTIAQEISRMQPGDEAIMKIDHLYIFAEPQGQHIRPCSRIALRPRPQTQPQADLVQPQQASDNNQQQNTPQVQSPLPTTIAPLDSAQQTRSESFSSRVLWKTDNNGNIVQERIDVRTKYDPATGQMVTRMYINGEEVDPNTRRPLNPKTAPAAPAPTQPAAAPVNSPQPNSGEDTVVE